MFGKEIYGCILEVIITKYKSLIGNCTVSLVVTPPFPMFLDYIKQCSQKIYTFDMIKTKSVNNEECALKYCTKTSLYFAL